MEPLRLSGLDASFVYLETPTTPMHIGGVYLLDGSSCRDFSHDRLYDHVEARLSEVPLFRRRLLTVPGNIGRPIWVDDPDFDLERHLPFVGCPHPGGKRELMELAGRMFARPLDRGRPLWEIALVDGIDNYPGLAKGSFALICRVHHAAVDGVSGAEVMGALLDITPEPRETPAPTAPWNPDPVPTSRELLFGGLGKAYERPAGLIRQLGSAVAGSIKSVVSEGHRPTMPFNAPETPFNRRVSRRRRFGGVELDLATIGQIRALVPGATINDALLAICAGALRRNLQASAALPDKSLVAMVPVSVRSAGDQAGNEVSAMFIKLATDEPDPRRRLALIHKRTSNSKAAGRALPAPEIMDRIPSHTAALAARLYTSARLADRHRPFFNLVITNVPGPPMKLYFAGAEVSKAFGTAPLFDGLGLILVIFSHAGKVSIGITADPDALDSVEKMEERLRESAQELLDIDPDAVPANPDNDDLPSAIARLGRSIDRLKERN